MTGYHPLGAFATGGIALVGGIGGSDMAASAWP
jgi:hypothetical protein